jgi:ferredoxin
MAAPAVFQLDDVDGHSTPINPDVPVDQEDAVRDAVLTCPEQAITAY